RGSRREGKGSRAVRWWPQGDQSWRGFVLPSCRHQRSLQYHRATGAPGRPGAVGGEVEALAIDAFLVCVRSPSSKLCDIYGPPSHCKVIIEDDKRGYRCGHIFGFVEQYRDCPALMDSARARLNKTQTSKGPCRKTGSEHAGLTPIAITHFSPSQPSASRSHYV